MVGGIVHEVLPMADRIWVNVVDHHEWGGADFCALYVERTPEAEQVRPGDNLWWQGRNAMWTPQEVNKRPQEELRCGQDFDIEIPRVGYSGARHPAQNLIDAAFAGSAI